MLRRHIFRQPITRTLKARLTSVATILYYILLKSVLKHIEASRTLSQNLRDAMLICVLKYNTDYAALAFVDYAGNRLTHLVLGVVVH